MKNPIIFWFRQDLRCQDLPGLSAAASTGQPLIALYILDDQTPGDWAMGAASRWWLHHSLTALGEQLEKLGGRLLLRRGATELVLKQVAQHSAADAVYCSRQYEPWACALEIALHQKLSAANTDFKRFPGTLLWEPETVATQSGTPFKVFTPFWRNRQQHPPQGPGCALPDKISWYASRIESDNLADWELCPRRPDWAATWPTLWQPGAAGARVRLTQFLDQPLIDYSEGRDYPGRPATSLMSPHLHFGEISPREIWRAAEQAAGERPVLAGEVSKYQRELAWRDFSYHLLVHFPQLPDTPFREEFGEFPWLGNEAGLRAWRTGQTGYPLVDAGMRELWATGYMHNRIRMVVASFLTKHLLVHWAVGERWFWDTLIDADLANNAFNWQWVAGSGADAAPYFRIFNPVTQGRKFDPEGSYTRRWVPELAALPDTYLHRPWEASKAVLEEAEVVLGTTYPRPVVDHREAREAALDAYQSMRNT